MTRRISVLVASILCSLATASPHVAAAAATIEEIVVTAQRRAESLQDVPIAVSAFGGEEIDSLGISDLRELTQYVAGVELFDDRGVSSQPTWIIRGVGLADFNANNTPTAAIYYDEFYLTSNVMGGIGMFDIERIEILKGAQGGLYGRNTTGGAVRVLSVRPSTDDASGYARASYGEWDRAQLEGGVGAALGDTVAFRLAGMTDQGGGWQDSLATPGDDEWGDRDFSAVRAQLLWQPSEATAVNLKVEGGRDESETTLSTGTGAYDVATGDFCAAVYAGRRDDSTCDTWATVTNAVLEAPLGPLAADQDEDGSRVLSNPIDELDNEWWSVTVQVDHDFDTVTLTSITGYIDYDNKQAYDYDGTQLELGHEFNHSPIESFSQELRLVSNDDGGPWSWLAGALYAYDSLDESRRFAFLDNVLVFGGLSDGDREFDQETQSWAVYGQLGYRVSEAVKVHGSLRYTVEDKSYRDGFATLNVTPGVPFDFVLPCCQSQNYQLDENWSGDAGVDWTPTENAMLYAKITRGFKSGGFFGGFALSEAETQPYVEETVWAYEIGAKSEWLDRTLRLNGAVFYYDYSDVQGFRQVIGEVNGEPLNLTKLDNVGDAEHVGVEADLLWLPGAIEGLSLTAGVAWLDAELDSDETFLSQLFIPTPFDGLERGYAPDWSYFAQGRYEHAIGSSLLGVVQVNYSWRDDLVTEETTGSAVDGALFSVDGYGLWNARVQIGAQDDRWNVAFVGRNLSDEEYLASTTADNLGSFTRTPGLPYNWAIELNVRWQ